LSRRAFLAAAGTGALGLALERPRALWALAESANRHRAAAGFHRPLPIPQVLRGADLHIPIREAELQILPGKKTRVWTYDGTFPGPTIRRPAGARTRVTFHHRLPASAGELTVHLHGGHNRSHDDGQPGGLTRHLRESFYCDVSPNLSAKQSGNDLLIEPGGRRTYEYELMEDGGPERAAFQWYHDHRLDHTSRNIWRGLAGMWIIDDELDSGLPLPRGDRDLPLLIADRSFDRHNQLTNPFADGARPPADGVTGHMALVNGAHRPYHEVAGQCYRLRLLNASSFRSYNLYLTDGLQMVQVASDSGLMPQPVLRDRVLLAPAERAEIVVDFSTAAGKRVELRSEPGALGPGGMKTFNGTLMQFRVGRQRPDSTNVPSSLRPLPEWTKLASPAPDRTWVVTISSGFAPTWLINGSTFDPARSDAFPALGSVETWQITNATDVPHVLHMHSTDWYMLARNGAPPPPWEDCLKESFLMGPGETILVAGHFTDYTGKYVIHCHMTDHEDHGLMDQFEVVAPADQPASDEVARRRRGAIPSHAAAPGLGLPARASAARDKLRFVPAAPSGEHLSYLDVAVNGRRRKRIRGDALGQPIELGLPAGAQRRVTLVGKTTDGRYLSATRDY
jgi:FtsP/CotA-like multicopper oxidase with cupredoxin domain